MALQTPTSPGDGVTLGCGFAWQVWGRQDLAMDPLACKWTEATRGCTVTPFFWKEL